MRIYLFTFLVLTQVLHILGQAGDGITRSIYDPSPDLQRRQPIMQQMGKDTRDRSFEDSIVYAATSVRPLSAAEKAELKRIKELIAVDREDLERYKGFLRDSHTGIFRLFPDFDCESKLVIKVDGNCLNIIPGVSTYSFRQKNYSADLNFFDIQLKGDNLLVKGFLEQEIITALGDVPIEDVKTASNGMKFLVDFKPEKEVQAVRNQYKQISNGIKEEGYFYSNVIKAEENMTYALRAIAYRKSLVTVHKFFLNVDDKRFVLLRYDKRKDITLVFRIIRKDDDGRLTILWKVLDSRNSPNLVFPKGEKLSDFKPKT